MNPGDSLSVIGVVNYIQVDSNQANSITTRHVLTVLYNFQGRMYKEGVSISVNRTL